MSTRALIAATLAFALHFPAAAQVRRDGAGAAPPPVISQTIAVQRGEKITVPLGIHGTRGEVLEFLIRQPPTFGKLSAVKSTTMNTAVVIYTPPARATAAEDHFAYAVRSSQGVSAPGIVTLRFVQPVSAPPKFRAPTELEFTQVFPGQRSTAEMELANDGGGNIEGEIAVPEPWTIEGLKFFRLAAGQRTTVRVIFTPTQTGVQTGEAVVSGSERKIIPLRASAEARLAASPSPLKLAAQPGSQTRTGNLTIANRSEEEATVIVEAGAKLLTDRSVKIPALGKTDLPIFADAAEVAAFDDAVKLTSNEWSATVPVHAVAVGGILKFSKGEIRISGRADDVASGVAILENSGGEPVTVRIDLVLPFEVEDRVVTAPPRGSVEFPVLVRNAVPGTFHSMMKAVGDGGSAVVPVTAEISKAAAARTPAPAVKIADENFSNSESAESSVRENEAGAISREARDIPNALGNFARATGPTSATLDWPVELGAAENARVEERVLSLSPSDELQVAWVPIAEVSVAPAAEHESAEMRGLKPATFYTVRVVTGEAAEPFVLFTSDFRTFAKKPIYSGSPTTPVLVLVLCVLVFAIWRSRRAPAQKRK